MDREAWHAAAPGVTKSRTQLSNWTELNWMGLYAMILIFWMLSFKPACSLSSFTLIKRLSSYCLLSAIRVVSSAYLNMKNWCFWTVVLEKTLESSLDSKEIKPVNPKGNQSWIFIGRTDAEAEAPILWLPEWTHQKRPWCWERLKAEGEGDSRGWDGWMASPTRLTWVEQALWVGDKQGSLVCCSS